MGGQLSNRSLIPLMGYKICAEEAENACKSLFDVFLASRVRLTAELAPRTTFLFVFLRVSGLSCYLATPPNGTAFLHNCAIYTALLDLLWGLVAGLRLHF